MPAALKALSTSETPRRQTPHVGPTKSTARTSADAALNAVRNGSKSAVTTPSWSAAGCPEATLAQPSRPIASHVLGDFRVGGFIVKGPFSGCGTSGCSTRIGLLRDGRHSRLKLRSKGAPSPRESTSRASDASPDTLLRRPVVVPCRPSRSQMPRAGQSPRGSEGCRAPNLRPKLHLTLPIRLPEAVRGLVRSKQWPQWPELPLRLLLWQHPKRRHCSLLPYPPSARLER